MFLVPIVSIGGWWFVLIVVGAAAFGAQITSHEERVHDYNLEDEELDKLHGIGQRLVGDEKKLINQIRTEAILAKNSATQAMGMVKRFFRRLLLWRK